MYQITHCHRSFPFKCRYVVVVVAPLSLCCKRYRPCCAFWLCLGLRGFCFLYIKLLSASNQNNKEGLAQISIQIDNRIGWKREPDRLCVSHTQLPRQQRTTKTAKADTQRFDGLLDISGRFHNIEYVCVSSWVQTKNAPIRAVIFQNIAGFCFKKTTQFFSVLDGYCRFEYRAQRMSGPNT